jgi:ubiquinone/menaquinone biosynthesis C-methylase UbiE
MAVASASTTRLTKFYGALSPSLDTVTAALSAAGVDPDHVQARDLYERDLDCHNLGMHRMLEVLAAVASEYRPPMRGEVVLDVGCGLGGPGRFLVDRFDCSVVGVDLLPLRVDLAQRLADLSHTSDRVSYRVDDATNLYCDDDSFSHVWMLDVGIHIRDKRALFGEIARVLLPDGLLVMHDQTGPLPKAMLPVRRQAPYIAPSLPQLIRYVENAGLRVLTWRDTTDIVVEHFRGIRSVLDAESEPGADAPNPQARAQTTAYLDAYLETLSDLGGRTGILVARRSGLPANTAR